MLSVSTSKVKYKLGRICLKSTKCIYVSLCGIVDDMNIIYTRKIDMSIVFY